MCASERVNDVGRPMVTVFVIAGGDCVVPRTVRASRISPVIGGKTVIVSADCANRWRLTHFAEKD
jgi:hypothetical protein